MICVGLFLFYVFNNLPGVIKNTLIIFASDRFVSKDTDDITKLHYWRDSDFTRETKASESFLLEFVSQFAHKRNNDDASRFDTVNDAVNNLLNELAAFIR